MLCAGDDDQFLGESGPGDQFGIAERLGHEGAIDLEAAQRVQRLPGRQRHEFQFDVRPRLVIARQHRRQPAGRRALHRCHPQPPMGPHRLHRVAGLVGQLQDAPRIVEQRLPGRGEHHALAVAQEQLHTERLLQLADARGHVRLHAVQPRGGACDATGLHHGAENLEFGEVHDRLPS
ncbi:hypothetical protein D3C81_1351770 [compost metagenome]